MPLIAAGTVVLEQGVCGPGWVETSGDKIVGCGAGAPRHRADVDLPDAVIVPGFVDIHVHGGGGATYTGGDATEVQRAAGFHREHGTTTTLASLVTASSADLLAAVPVLAESSGAGIVAGIHLEGPWLSAAHCGAHDHTQLRDPTPAEIDGLLAAGDGAIRMVTLAPERPGSDDAITRLLDAGVVVALGHTNACYEQTRRAIELGAVAVDVVERVAGVRGTSTIAGSTATMDQLFGAVAGHGSDRDTALAAAVCMTSTTPARALGFDGAGSLRVGAEANLVALEPDYRVGAVMARGSWVSGG